jgi:threonine dehydratase
VLTRDDVFRAREAIGARLVRTPTLYSPELGAHLKCELFQRTGSFKDRGALNRISALTPAERERGVITISAGNHAQAVAWAAATQHVEALVVMPQSAADHKAAAAEAYGATVDRTPKTWSDAFEHLDRLLEETGRALVHPHEDPLVLAGAGTLALELEQDVPGADAIVVGVGGGGLIGGIQAAVGDRVRVVAVEPELSQAFHAAAKAGHPVTLEPSSIADGLNSPRFGALPFELCRDLERVLVTEDEIAEAMRFLYARAKLAVEPAGAAATAALLTKKITADNPVVVVSGGNVAPEIASDILDFR